MKNFFGVNTATDILLGSLRQVGFPVANSSQQYSCPYKQNESSKAIASECCLGLPYPNILYSKASQLIFDGAQRKDQSNEILRWKTDENLHNSSLVPDS